MTSVAQRIRERLRHAKASSTTSISSSTNTVPPDASISTVCLHAGTGREGSVADLKVATALLLRSNARTIFDSTGAIYHALVGKENIERWFKHYCLEPYPLVCRCGATFISNIGGIKFHCPSCDGKNFKTNEYMYRELRERARVNAGLHYSWVEYSAAWALARFKPVGGTYHER